MENKKIISIDTISDFGLLYKINKEILHPLGIALSRTNTGVKNSSIITFASLKSRHTSEVIEKREKDLKNFYQDTEKNIKDKLISQKDSFMEKLAERHYDFIEYGIANNNNHLVSASKETLVMLGVDEKALDRYIEEIRGTASGKY